MRLNILRRTKRLSLKRIQLGYYSKKQMKHDFLFEEEEPSIEQEMNKNEALFDESVWIKKIKEEQEKKKNITPSLFIRWKSRIMNTNLKKLPSMGFESYRYWIRENERLKFVTNRIFDNLENLRNYLKSKRVFRILYSFLSIVLYSLFGFLLAFYLKNRELFGYYDGYGLSISERFRLTLYLAIFFEVCRNPNLITNLASFLSRFIGTDFINRFICRQLIRLLSLEVVVKGSKRLFKENILKKMVLGSPKWDRKIADLVMRILKNPAVKDAILKSIYSLITSPNIERMAALKLIDMVNNNEDYKEAIRVEARKSAKAYLHSFGNMHDKATRE